MRGDQRSYLINQGALCSTFHELRQFDIHEKPVAFDDIGLSRRHRLVGRATRPEVVAVLAECRVPLRLKPLQERLLGLRDQLRLEFPGWASRRPASESSPEGPAALVAPPLEQLI